MNLSRLLSDLSRCLAVGAFLAAASCGGGGSASDLPGVEIHNVQLPGTANDHLIVEVDVLDAAGVLVSALPAAILPGASEFFPLAPLSTYEVRVLYDDSTYAFSVSPQYANPAFPDSTGDFFIGLTTRFSFDFEW